MNLRGQGIVIGDYGIVLLVLLAVFAVIVLRAIGSPRRRRRREDRRLHRWRGSPHGTPSGEPGDAPNVNLLHLVVAVLFSPFVLLYWGLANLGDLLLFSVNAFFGVFELVRVPVNAMVGGSPSHAWVAAKDRLSRAWISMRRAGFHLLTCFGLGGLVEHIRADLAAGPEILDPPPDHWPFEDRYRIESRLGSGGSTAQLFIVRRMDGLRPVGDQVVLKYFDLRRGSHLEEVIRESRGMQTAKEMGIVLDHQLERDHFYYVMPYYEGETLTRASARLHRQLPAEDGLAEEDAGLCLEWMAELLRILDGYHHHGVIHKDVKPDNVIVTDRGIRLVDLGLLTPLTSAMTLTTHGTEYFRDPEMVKLAIQGHRVKDVHAARFDIYSAGAVLYLLFEGSFPACGPLSSYSKPVPMAVSWITSRAMAEGGKRYPSIAAMRADLDALLDAAGSGGLHSVAANRLPSFRGFKETAAPPRIPVLEDVAAPVAADRPPRARRRGPLVGSIVVLLAVAAMILVLRPMLQEDPGVPPTAAFSIGLVDDQIREVYRDGVAACARTYAGTPDEIGNLSSVPVYVASDESVPGRAAANRVVQVIRGLGHAAHELAPDVVRASGFRVRATPAMAAGWVRSVGGPERALVVVLGDLRRGELPGYRQVTLQVLYRKFADSGTVHFPESASPGGDG